MPVQLVSIYTSYSCIYAGTEKDSGICECDISQSKAFPLTTKSGNDVFVLLKVTS